MKTLDTGSRFPDKSLGKRGRNYSSLCGGTADGESERGA
jgi:hypothetical protein